MKFNYKWFLASLIIISCFLLFALNVLFSKKKSSFDFTDKISLKENIYLDLKNAPNLPTNITEDMIKIEKIYNKAEKCIIFFSVKNNDFKYIGNIGFNKNNIDFRNVSTELYENRIVDIGEKQYIYIFGKNHKNKVNKVIAKNDTLTYEIDVNNQEFFVEEFELSKLDKTTDSMLGFDWIFYDGDNNDITKELTNDYYSIFDKN